MFFEYVHMGIAHIGALLSEWYGPQGFHLPDGIDHILFILALVLSGGGFWEMLKTATGFTVGHSITLALAVFGVVHFPSRLIESAIALSVVYVAAEDLFRKNIKHRWKIAAAFGLVHGFGFATALESQHFQKNQALITLAGFNLGVEIGQAMIIATLTPLVLAMSREPVLKKYGLTPCSFGVLGAGTYWFFSRAFF